MKKTTNCIFIVIVIMLFINTQCEPIAMDRKYPITLINNDSFTIGFYFATGGKFGTYYPDSLPETTEFVGILESGKKYYYDSSIKWDKIFKYFPKDTLSIFILHSDTLNKYTWAEVRKGYKILKRYDLSLNDLRQRNWTITYP